MCSPHTQMQMYVCTYVHICYAVALSLISFVNLICMYRISFTNNLLVFRKLNSQKKCVNKYVCMCLLLCIMYQYKCLLQTRCTLSGATYIPTSNNCNSIVLSCAESLSCAVSVSLSLSFTAFSQSVPRETSLS